MRFAFILSYDGTNYAGWQRQKNALSVQEVVEDAFCKALQKKYTITASGRTDAGVHAWGQVCHFDGDDCPVPAEKIPDCINRFLPDDIRLLRGFIGGEGFDCSRLAKRKTYRYSLYESPYDLPLKNRYAVRVEHVPALAELKKYATFLEGEHDYKSFCASGSSVKTTVRTVYEVKVEEKVENNCRFIDIFVTGNGFLYNMVRNMVGELLDLSLGKRTVESLEEAYQTGKRSLIGKTMPAKGLTLMNVEYEL